MSDRKRAILIGIAGASCSGKTTLAKHLSRILTGSILLHQDDYARPAAELPIHPIHQVQDWDDPEGAIDWPALEHSLRHLQEHSALPDSHKSHDYMNWQAPVPIPEELIKLWRDRLTPYFQAYEFVLCEGFVMYYNQVINDLFDVKFLLREDYDLLKKRREERNGYYTASQSDAAGELWKDPPQYWENIVWPAYIKSYQAVFTNHDPIHGVVDTTAPAGRNVLLLDVPKIGTGPKGMAQMIEQCCERIEQRLRVIESGDKV